MQPSTKDVNIHNDVANMGYGVIIGFDTLPGMKGLWEA